MAVTLERIRARADTVLVPMNEVRSGPWSSSLQFMVTEGLNGCTAITILSNKAVVLAHVAPRTPTTDGEQNVRALMQLVIQHYNTRKTEGFFPDSTTSIILAAVYDGTVALPEQINITRAVLVRLGLPITSRQYRVREQGENRTAGETSMIIHGRDSREPHTYVNDQLMSGSTAKSSGSSTAGSTPQSGTSRATPPVVPPQSWAGYPLRTTADGATLLRCIIVGRSVEVPVSWPQGPTGLPMVWIRSSWLQTERHSNENVLLVRDPNRALARMERPTA